MRTLAAAAAIAIALGVLLLAWVAPDDAIGALDRADRHLESPAGEGADSMDPGSSFSEATARPGNRGDSAVATRSVAALSGDAPPPWLRIQVVDAEGRPRAGIPVAVRAKPISFLYSDLVQLESIPEGLILGEEFISAFTARAREPQPEKLTIRVTQLVVQGRIIENESLFYSASGPANPPFEPPLDSDTTLLDEPLWRGETADPDGIAQVPELNSSGTELYATLDLPTLVPVRVAIDREALSGDTLRLVLPSLRELEIHCVQDLPLDAAGPWKLRLAAWSTESGEDPSWCTWHDWRAVENGRRVRFLADTGVRLELQAWLAAPFATLLRRVPAGPLGSDGVERLTLRSSAVYTRYRARVLDPGGKPLARRKLEAELALDGIRGESLSVGHTLQADGAGVIEFLLDMVSVARSRRELSLVLENRRTWVVRTSGEGNRFSIRTSTPEPIHPDEREVHIDLSPPQHPGAEIDLGDLVLGTGPLLVDGVVVDPEGRPVPRARVHLGDEAFAADAGGRFHRRGFTREEQLVLHAEIGGFYPSPRASIPPGATGVELGLRPAGGLAGSVVLPAGVSLEVLVQAVRGDAELCDSATVRGNGEILLSDLPAGEVDVVLTVDALEHRISGITVEAGRITRDSRLQRIDLLSGGILMRLRLVAPGGTPVAKRGYELRAFAAQAEISSSASTDAQGWLTFVATEAVQRVEVEPLGAPAIEVPVVAGERNLVVVDRLP